MKKHIRLFAMLLAVVMVAATVPVIASAASLSQMKIVAFGDSITHYGATDTGNKDSWGNKIYSDAYPDYLGNILGVNVVNTGVGGNTTDMALDRLWNEVTSENPDIVIICLGMNDQAYNQTSGALTPLAPYRANLERYVEEIRKVGGDVVFMTPHPVCDASGYFTYYGDPNYNYGLLPQYCNAMREVAVKYGCSFVDMYAEFKALGDSMKDYMAKNDGVHQNDAGRRLYAQIISEHLKAVYENTNKATMTIRCTDNNGNIIIEYPLVGAAGAVVTVPTPDIPAYTTTDADVSTTFVNGAIHTFKYTSDIMTAVAEAGKVVASDYDADVVIALQKEYSAAMEQYFAATPNFDLMKKSVVKLNNLIKAKGEGELLLSSGMPYTATQPNYHKWNPVTGQNDGPLSNPHADDGKRLTDGNIGDKNGGCSAYSTWVTDAEIIIEFDDHTEADVFRCYSVYGEEGVLSPSQVKAYYLNSEGSWVELSGNCTTTELVADTGDKAWGLNKIEFIASAPVAAKKFRMVVVKYGSFIRIDEVEIARRVAPDEVNDNLIHGANSRIENATTKVFTPGFKVTGDSANLNWTANVRAVWDDAKHAYIITDTFEGSGTTTTETLGEDEIILAAHCGDASENWYTYDLLSRAQKGQAIFFNGVDMSNGVAIGATFEIVEYEGTDDSTLGKEGNVAFGKKYDQNGFYVNGGMYPANYTAGLTDGKAAETLDYHYQNQWFGISMNSDDDGSANADANGVCSIVIDLGDNYDINNVKVNAFVGNQDGIAKPAKIEAFISESSNGGYTSIGELVAGQAKNNVAWYSVDGNGIGRYLKIEVTIARYDDGVPYTYAFINEIEAYGVIAKDDENEGENDDENNGGDNNGDTGSAKKGDVNDNGKIDARDYLLLKRAFFKTYTLTCDLSVADINDNGKLDARDYLLLKRAFFKTYEIK